MKLNSGRLWLKTAVFTLLAICLLFMALGTLYFQRFDATAVRATLTRQLAERGFEARFTGSISPYLLPLPGLEISQLDIHQPGQAQALVRISGLRASLAWIPLLAGRHELRRIAIESLQARLERQEDGNLNLARLLEQGPRTDLAVQLDSLTVGHAGISYRDLASGQQLTLSDTRLALDDMQADAHLQLDGKLAQDKRTLSFTLSAPYRQHAGTIQVSGAQANMQLSSAARAQGQFSLSGNIAIHPASWSAEASALQLGFRLPASKLSIEGSIPRASLSLAEIRVPKISGHGEMDLDKVHYTFSSAIDNLLWNPAGVYAETTRAELVSARGPHHITLQLAAPLQLVGLDQLRMEPLRLNARLVTPTLPRGQLVADLAGALTGTLADTRFNWRAQGKLDGTPLSLTLEQSGFLPPQHKATLSIEALDLNRYLPEAKPEQAVALLQDTTPLQLEWMDFLHLKGKVDIGELNMGRFRAFDVKADVEAGADSFAVDNLSAKIYEGTLSGSARLQRGKQATLTLKQRLDGMHIRPLLLDLFNFNRIEGNGSGEVDLVAHGSSLAALRSTLTGDASVRLSQGALTGIDLVAALKNLPAELKDWSKTSIVTDQKQKTTFQSLSASFDLDSGVARNQDLELRSQLVNVKGNGKVDLKESIIDYTLDVKANPKSFSRMASVNVPLKITGQVNAPTYALDFNAMVKGKTTPGEKQQALKQELQKQITTILP